MSAVSESWVPDGHGLDPVSRQVAVERAARVHLRLSVPGSDRYPRTACAAGLAELWSGQASEVTCTDCLQAVHA